MTSSKTAMACPGVSIALPVYNAAKTLPLAIRSMLRQTFTDFELIILDDGSTDDSAQVIARFDDPRIRYISDGRNRGLAARLNQAIDLARGKYIARMDADDVSYPERLARQVSYLDQHPDVDLLGTGALIFQGNGEVVSRFPVQMRHDDICRQPWKGFCLAHPSWMGRADWFRKFRYRYPEVVRAEDQDLLLRSCRSSRFANLMEPLLGYRQEPITAGNVGRIVLAKRSYAIAAARFYWQSRQLPMAFFALAVQYAKSVVYRFSAALGLNRYLLSHLALPTDSHEVAQWQALWMSLQDEGSSKDQVKMRNDRPGAK